MTHDVYRDTDGAPVTITGEQAAAVWHAISVWQAICRENDYPTDGELFTDANIRKSCLLGRMLFEGRPPLPEPPPLVHSTPAYHLTDPDLCPSCGAGRDGPGGRLAVSIDQGHAQVIMGLFPDELRPVPGRARTIVECIEPWHTKGLA